MELAIKSRLFVVEHDKLYSARSCETYEELLHA
jgi:hypothetical protein